MMRGQTLTIVRDLMVFALVSSKDNDTRNAFENLRPVCEAKDQKPRFCPICGAKNKMTVT